MKREVFITAVLCFTMLVAKAQVQTPITRHFELKSNDVNHVLSPPTSKGERIVAIPKNERLSDGNSFTTRKNTIELFRLNIADNTPISDEVSIIGMKTTAEKEFDKNVNFEVHSIVESCYPAEIYILCGSMSLSEGGILYGIVAILDENLNIVSLRYYPDVKVFYSAYAQDHFYFVCGQMQNSTAIVLRDNIYAPIPPVNIKAFCTPNHQNWAFNKISAKNPRPCSYEFSVYGSRGNGDKTETSCCVFQISRGTFTLSDEDNHSNPENTINTVDIDAININPISVENVYISGKELDRFTKKIVINN